MKQVFFTSAFMVLLACPAFAQSSDSTPPPSAPPSSPMSMMSPISPDEQMELRKAHDAALADDASLAKAVKKFQAEGQALQAEGRALQDRMRDAMIKADPKVAPVIAKIEAMRSGGVPPPTGNSQPMPPPPSAPH